MSDPFTSHRHIRLNGFITAVTVAYTADPKTRKISFGFAFCSPSENCFSKKKGREGNTVFSFVKDKNGRKITEKGEDGIYRSKIDKQVHYYGAYDRLKLFPLEADWPQDCLLIDLILVTLMQISVAPSILQYKSPNWLAPFAAVKFTERLSYMK